MDSAAMAIGIIGVLVVVGFVAGSSCKRRSHIDDFIKSGKPHCQTDTLWDKPYKRCWKAVEIEAVSPEAGQ